MRNTIKIKRLILKINGPSRTIEHLGNNFEKAAKSENPIVRFVSRVNENQTKVIIAN
jgi:hypothetical protein